MFGQDWDRAEARIIARDAKFSGDGSVATYTYVADVRLPSGETFRATLKEPTIATNFWAPDIGDMVSVLVRTKDRKVKFDKDDDRLSVKAHDAARKQAFEAAQQQPAGTPAGSPTDSVDLPAAVTEKLAKLGLTGGVSATVLPAGSPEAQAALAGFLRPAPNLDPEERLLRLKTLNDKGLLSAEEYDEQRRRILDEL